MKHVKIPIYEFKELSENIRKWKIEGVEKTFDENPESFMPKDVWAELKGFYKDNLVGTLQNYYYQIDGTVVGKKWEIDELQEDLRFMDNFIVSFQYPKSGIFEVEIKDPRDVLKFQKLCELIKVPGEYYPGVRVWKNGKEIDVLDLQIALGQVKIKEII